MNNCNSRFLNLGVLALPIFCCLVGALMIMCLSRPSQQPPPLTQDEINQAFGRLAQDRADLARARQLDEVISNRLTLIQYRTDNDSLDAQSAKLLAEKNKMTNEVTGDQLLQARLEELQRAIDSTHGEIAKTKEHIAQLREREQAAATNDVLPLIGQFSGNPVLLECDCQGVIVHPGGRRLSADATDADLQPVYDAIARAGFVALVSRPDGFDKSFDHFQHLVFDRVDEMNQTNATPIGRCSFPLADNASLTAFVAQ